MKIYTVVAQALNQDRHIDEVCYFHTYEAAEHVAKLTASMYKDLTRKGNCWVTPHGRVPLMIKLTEVADDESLDTQIKDLEYELNLEPLAPFELTSKKQ